MSKNLEKKKFGFGSAYQNLQLAKNQTKFEKFEKNKGLRFDFGVCKTKPFDGQTLTENTKGWDTPRPNLYYCEICKCAYLVAFRFLKHPACALLF
jgi:hypothetical protein